MSMFASILAVSWEPELRGVLTVIIAVVVLCGSVYLILGTNIGARLGFLVALTGLFGWMFLMGVVWWIYGIGLTGEDPSWRQVPGRTVIQDSPSLVNAGVLEQPLSVGVDASPLAQRDAVRQQLLAEGWEIVPEDDRGFGQAASAAGSFLRQTGAFGPGEYQVTSVYQIGGERWPKLGESVDFVAFFHNARYALAEVGTLEELRTEAGRAPFQPQIDDRRPKQYVYMVRDLGTVRQPAALLTIGSGIIFLALCWTMNRRDKLVEQNRSQDLVPSG